MEKMELYRKYRPETLDDMVGNEATIKAVKKELENGSHVFLMTGPAGTGKTTLARIIAKEVGADDLGIHEINSAENRGIDTAREIMEQMRYLPSTGKANVWILDEIHQQTNASQNALLKPLEDTPEHVYFFLCTTNPEKLIKPLVSRCSVVTMQPLKDSEMAFLLKRTSKAEGRKITKEVGEKIIEIAQGGSRKALKTLAKVLYLDDVDEQLEVLKKETVSDDIDTKELCQACMKNTSLTNLFSILKNIDLSEPERVRQAVMGYMNSVLLNGKISQEIVATLQAFSSADTYRNGKFALTVALLDRDEMLG